MSSKTLTTVILSSVLAISFSSMGTENQKPGTDKVCKEMLNTKICDATDNCQEVSMQDVLEELVKNGCVQVESKPGSSNTSCTNTICGTR